MIPQVSSFTSYILTEQEELQGAVFGTLQKALIQNQICAAAEEKLSLTFDPQNPQKFLQQEAELQGRILALRYLLTSSEDSILKLSQPHNLNSQEN